MPARRLVALLLLTACSDGGEPTSSGASATATTDASGTTTAGSDASTGTTAAESATGSATGGATETGTDTGTTGASVRCGDGVASPGELCLRPPVLVPAGSEPVDLASADLDRDGHLDLAIVDIAGPGTLVLYGDGLGEFRSVLDLPGLSLPRSVAAIVTDEAAPRDLVVADLMFGALGHYRADARPRTYALPTASALGDKPRALIAADLDGDGDDDLVVVAEGSDEVIVAFHEGGAMIETASYPVGDEPYHAALGDLDGDGDDDLAVVNRADASASVLLGHGDGTFGAAQSYATADDPRAVAIADLDADGHPDLAIACYAGYRIQLLRNSGTGVDFVPIELPVGAGVYAIAAGDLDHDGRPDLAAADFDGGELVLLRDFAAELPSVDRRAAPGGPFDVVLDDFNEDGALDVAVAAIHADGIHLFLSNP